MKTNQQNENSQNDFFTESDYKELQRNLILYKKGNAEAVTYICQAFHQFLTKYAKFITYGVLPHTPFIDKNGNRYVFRENGIMNYKVNFYLNDEESES